LASERQGRRPWPPPPPALHTQDCVDWPNSPLEISRVIGAINLRIFEFVVEALISSQEPPVLPPAGGSYLPTALKQHRAGTRLRRSPIRRRSKCRWS
jgi:hypothetical protein